ncbi:MAG: hypothetical protein GF320_12745 [Armatimonadia bacterium]|nr:hypothetical protein [Armatimonadia bacterium]
MPDRPTHQEQAPVLPHQEADDAPGPVPASRAEGLSKSRPDHTVLRRAWRRQACVCGLSWLYLFLFLAMWGTHSSWPVPAALLMFLALGMALLSPIAMIVTAVRLSRAETPPSAEPDAALFELTLSVLALFMPVLIVVML